MKKTFAATAVAAAASAVLLAGAPAHAHSNKTSGAGSVAGGNQVVVPIGVAASICGINAVNVIGSQNAFCKGVAKNNQN
nr:DUF320 domain-containing protein [Nocardiopsis mwathae]